MSTRSDWTARHLDRLDDRPAAYEPYSEMAVAVSVSTPKLEVAHWKSASGTGI